MAGNLAGSLFWRIGGFESNPPIFHTPKLYSVLSSILVIIASTCTIDLQLVRDVDAQCLQRSTYISCSFMEITANVLAAMFGTAYSVCWLNDGDSW